MLVVGEEQVVQRVGLGDQARHDQRRVVAGLLELVGKDGKPGVEALEPGARRGPRQDREVIGPAAERDPHDAGEDVGRGPSRELGRPQPGQLGMSAEGRPPASRETDAEPGADPEPHEEAQGQRQDGDERVGDHEAVVRIRIRQGEVDRAFGSIRPAST